mgnify:CR=1 FL=1
MLENKTILVGITGGIAAYKICSLIRLYKKAGANVKAEKLIAVHDWQKNNGKGYESAISVYKMFFLCTYIDGEFRENTETIESAWFAFDELPELCLAKNTKEQIKICFEAYDDINFMCRFD